MMAYGTKTKVGVLDKAMVILNAFERSDVALHPKEVAARTGLPISTVYRLLRALEEHGMLEAHERSRYRLGIALLRLGSRVAEGLELRRQVRPHLEWLNERTGENAELQVRREQARVPLDLVRSSQHLRPIVEVGTAVPLHLGAAGKVLLAWLPKEEWEPLAVASVARFGDERTFDLEHLRLQLLRVRQEGWAASSGERSAGVAAIAAPVFDALGDVTGAVLVSAPAARMLAKQRRKYVPLVREAAARASRSLGFQGVLPSTSTRETA
jgi:DNA-binding IclR family transcriptional regulator